MNTIETKNTPMNVAKIFDEQFAKKYLDNKFRYTMFVDLLNPSYGQERESVAVTNVENGRGFMSLMCLLVSDLEDFSQEIDIGDNYTALKNLLNLIIKAEIKENKSDE